MANDKVANRCDMACAILEKTNDGNDLTPSDLYLLECIVNGLCTEAGNTAFDKLFLEVVSGSYIPMHKRPLFGQENLTKDSEGFVYWKGKRIEHYSFYNDPGHEREKAAAESLAFRCRELEKAGQPVTLRSVMGQRIVKAGVKPLIDGKQAYLPYDIIVS